MRRFVYDDATGKPVPPGTTARGKVKVGVRRNLVDTGLFTDEIGSLLRNDIGRRRGEIDHQPPDWEGDFDTREDDAFALSPPLAS